MTQKWTFSVKAIAVPGHSFIQALRPVSAALGIRLTWASPALICPPAPKLRAAALPHTTRLSSARLSTWRDITVACNRLESLVGLMIEAPAPHSGVNSDN